MVKVGPDQFEDDFPRAGLVERIGQLMQSERVLSMVDVANALREDFPDVPRAVLKAFCATILGAALQPIERETLVQVADTPQEAERAVAWLREAGQARLHDVANFRRSTN